jgi:serine/threonine-protein kinase SIK3
MRDVLRGKLNSPVRRIQEEISEEKEPLVGTNKTSKEPVRNDNQVKLEKEKKLEKMRNSELVAVKKKNPRRKRTQLYDNKSAMMMLERSKKISHQNSPVRKSGVKKFGQLDSQGSKNQSLTKGKPKKQSISKLYKKQTKKPVMVMKSRRKNNSRSKHIDFVNMSQERSTIGDRSKERSSKNSRVRKKRDATLSKECSKNNSISRNTRKKQSTVDKKGNVKKFNSKNKRKGNKKRERLRKDTMDTKGSKSNSRVKKRGSKQRESRNVSFNKKNRDSKKTTAVTESQAKGGKREKTNKVRTLKNKTKELDKKRKHGSILEPKQMKRVLEMKIMKYSTLGKVIDTSLEFYDLKRMLGEGSYAKVHLGVSILCNRKVAIKLYEKAKIKTRSSSERIFTEIGILRRMNHRNIVNFIEIFQNPKYIFIVLEYANGGDLLNYLKTKGRFKEPEYRKILQQIIDALEYIHEHKILHRDIKLDNILLTKTGHVKICDFGISRKMHRNDPVFEHIGTPAYIAPEIIKEKGYTGFGADIWSLGVMTYMALTGNVPFKGNTIEELHQSILTKDVTFSEKANLSNEMKRAIKGMLVKDPRRRMNLKDICKILDLRPTLSQKKEKDYADEEVVAEIKGYGYPEKMIKESLVNDMINHITALYKLLKN